MRPAKLNLNDIDSLATLLKQAGVDFGAEDVADALWLAGHMGESSPGGQQKEQNQNRSGDHLDIREEFIDSNDDPNDPRRAQVSLPPRQTQAKTGGQSKSGIALKAPAAPALRVRLDLARALRPLRRQVPSPDQLEFDEAATLEQIADQQVWFPVLRPVPERWLEVALVVEAMAALPLWQNTIEEFNTLLERQGAFRRVTTWRLETKTVGRPQLFPHWRRLPHGRMPRRTEHLWDAASRRLILLVSDCTSQAWYDGSIVKWLDRCGRQAPTAVVQLLPEWLWPQTALGQGTSMWLRAIEPGTVSANLISQHRVALLQELLALGETQAPKGVTIPIITLEAEPLKQWARVVAGAGDNQTLGVQFDRASLTTAKIPTATPTASSPEERVQQFRTTASLTAQRLAELMAAAPVSPPVIDLIRQTLLPRAEPVHVAEVYMGGLMAAQAIAAQAGQPPTLEYDFAPGVRAILADALSKSQTMSVLDAISRYISERLGLNTKSFEALLRLDFQGDSSAQDLVLPFAEIAIPTLQRMGGEYANIADHLANASKLPPPSPTPSPDDRYPLLQTYTFREATLVFEADPEPPPVAAQSQDQLHSFEFETTTLQIQPGQTQLLVQRRPETTQQFIQDLGQISLEMVYIPPGTFQMGSPETETGRRNSESPQHPVTLAEPFFIGKYPVTQAQWRVVAGLSQVGQELDPDPSEFKGDNCPVEQVSWHDATEFCARLSQHTGRNYRLPTEAEWEYACRAGTTTPFHFGQSITTDLANYRGTDWEYQGKTYSGAYGNGPHGEFRQKTTDVGAFKVANAFGLYDMHGNVLEWCQDWWHDSYEAAPEDGRAWLSHGEEGEERRVLRGGSWGNDPGDCRSALRRGRACSQGPPRRFSGGVWRREDLTLYPFALLPSGAFYELIYKS